MMKCEWSLMIEYVTYIRLGSLLRWGRSLHIMWVGGPAFFASHITRGVGFGGMGQSCVCLSSVSTGVSLVLYIWEDCSGFIRHHLYACRCVSRVKSPPAKSLHVVTLCVWNLSCRGYLLKIGLLSAQQMALFVTHHVHCGRGKNSIAEFCLQCNSQNVQLGLLQHGRGLFFYLYFPYQYGLVFLFNLLQPE